MLVSECGTACEHRMRSMTTISNVSLQRLRSGTTVSASSDRKGSRAATVIGCDNTDVNSEIDGMFTIVYAYDHVSV